MSCDSRKLNESLAEWDKRLSDRRQFQFTKAQRAEVMRSYAGSNRSIAASPAAQPSPQEVEDFLASKSTTKKKEA